jgi:hypothetical protein
MIASQARMADKSCQYHGVTDNRWMWDAGCALEGPVFGEPAFGEPVLEEPQLENFVEPTMGNCCAPMGDALDVARSEARKKILLFGLIGAAVGGLATGLLSAWAFHARDPHRPVAKPALILGVGSFGVAALGIGAVALSMDEQVAVMAQGMALAK